MVAGSSPASGALEIKHLSEMVSAFFMQVAKQVAKHCVEFEGSKPKVWRSLS
jgi:hypothetical protein